MREQRSFLKALVAAPVAAPLAGEQPDASSRMRNKIAELEKREAIYHTALQRIEEMDVGEPSSVARAALRHSRGA